MLALKREEILLHVTTSMNLENMLHELSQIENDKIV